MDTAATTRRTRQLLAGFALFLLLGAGISAGLSLRGEEQRNLALAGFLAQSTFDSVVSARKWNALHGGVYVPVTERFPPNPYLDDPLRDLTTTQGMQLTKVNPAYMTRLIAEIDDQEHGVRVHITSLDPIRPGNAPDSWERAALEAFAKGSPLVTEVVPGVDGTSYRYMRPLLTANRAWSVTPSRGTGKGTSAGASASRSPTPRCPPPKGMPGARS